jgi:hypothetical protein
MNLWIDHLVVAARTLEEGSAYIAGRLGVAPVPGGRHAFMGTHNRLLGLGPGVYLEVIAVDPDAPPPARPRWFALDSAPMRRRLERSPALVHWVARTDDLDRALAAAPFELGEAVAASRGDFRWRITQRPDGSLPGEGALPALIQWAEGPHPSDALPDSGCRLLWLELHHPQATEFLAGLRAIGLDPGAPLSAGDGRPGLAATLRTPSGTANLD